ncbi:MAG: sel1 repeat family protein [Selenomonadaceae bacterium]|nr:sel1 repeat family protein [Selenomonadaceae bacterium]
MKNSEMISTPNLSWRIYICVGRKISVRRKKNFKEYLAQAKNGGAKEMIRVGLIYAGGLGVAKDLSAAKKFFNAVKGNEE